MFVLKREKKQVLSNVEKKIRDLSVLAADLVLDETDRKRNSIYMNTLHSVRLYNFSPVHFTGLLTIIRIWDEMTLRGLIHLGV